MRICILTHTFPRYKNDFAAPFMDGVAEGIRAAGNEVFVLTPFISSFKRKKTDQKYNIITYKYIFPDSLHKLGYSQTLSNDKKLKIIMWFLSPLMYFFGTIALIRLIKKEKIDVVNAHWILPNGFIAGVAKIFTGVKVVSTLPGSDVYMAQKNSLFGLLAKFATYMSDWVTSNSPQLLDDLAKIYTKDDSEQKKLKIKFSPIIYGVDPEIFKPINKMNKIIRKKLNVPSNDLIILGVGRLVAKKGFKYLIKAMPAILKANKNITFVVIGEGDQRQELEDLAKNLGVDNKLKLPGWVNYDELVYYYNVCDVFILPSVRDEEGNLDDQSVSVVEAMACGKPIVTANFPGYRIVIEENVNGYLIETEKYKQIERALNRLVTSQQLRVQMGNESRDLILNNFTWDQIGRQYTQLFRKIYVLEKYYSKGISKILDSKDRLRIAKQIDSVIKDYQGNTKSLKCLDIACSSGVITNYMTDSFQEIIGIDIDESALELARKNYFKNNLRFDYMNAEKLTFKDSTFDVVICNQVYNFVEDPNKLIKEIYRVLKPGGICFFSARNKFALIEPQYGLPFLSWLPYKLGKTYIHFSNKGNEYFGKNYLSYKGLKHLVSNFKVIDYTTKVLKNPLRYRFYRLTKYKLLAKMLPLDLLLPLMPNFVWLLKKSNI